MTIPAIVFGFLVASFMGALFHLWRGGGPKRLLLYMVFSWVGFIGGQFFGREMGLDFFAVGPLYMGMAVLGSLVVLGIGYWLSLIRFDEEEPKTKTTPPNPRIRRN